MTNLTPPEAAYAVYRKRFCTPEADTPWENLSEGARGFWAEVAEAAAAADRGHIRDVAEEHDECCDVKWLLDLLNGDKP